MVLSASKTQADPNVRLHACHTAVCVVIESKQSTKNGVDTPTPKTGLALSGRFGDIIIFSRTSWDRKMGEGELILLLSPRMVVAVVVAAVVHTVPQTRQKRDR